MRINLQNFLNSVQTRRGLQALEEISRDSSSNFASLRTYLNQDVLHPFREPLYLYYLLDSYSSGIFLSDDEGKCKDLSIKRD